MDDLVVFPLNRAAGTVKTRPLTLLGFCSPSKYVPSAASPDPQVKAPLMRFCPLQHIKARRSGSRGFCRPATFRPQGLTSLSAVYSLRTPARHVPDRRHSWGSPFGGFLSWKVTQPPGRIEPTRRFRLRQPRSKPRSLLRRPTSGLSPSQEPVARTQGVSLRPNPFLPWVSCPLGYSPSRLGRPFGRSPLVCLGRPRRTPQPRAYTSAYQSAAS
jgi:hypothetical protein